MLLPCMPQKSLRVFKLNHVRQYLIRLLMPDVAQDTQALIVRPLTCDSIFALENVSLLLRDHLLA